MLCPKCGVSIHYKCFRCPKCGHVSEEMKQREEEEKRDLYVEEVARFKDEIDNARSPRAGGQGRPRPLEEASLTEERAPDPPITRIIHLVNPPYLLIPELSHYTGTLESIVCVMGMNLSNEMYAFESIPVNPRELDLAYAENITNALTRIPAEKLVFIGLLNLSYNKFESPIDMHLSFEAARIMGTLGGPTPNLGTKMVVPLILHCPSHRYLLNNPWTTMAGMIQDLDNLNGSIYGICCVGWSNRELNLHFFILEDDLLDDGILRNLTAYPKVKDELMQAIKKKKVFPVIWFRLDFGQDFAISRLPGGDHVKEFGVLKEALSTYNKFVLQWISPSEGQTITAAREKIKAEQQKRDDEINKRR